MTATRPRLRCAAAAVAVLIAAPAFAQNQEYRRCPEPAMQRGMAAVQAICGAAPAKPVLPGYPQGVPGADPAWASLSGDLLRRLASARDAYEVDARAYQACIDQRVMGDAGLPMATLDLAACAHQYIGEQVTAVQADWGLTCMAYEDFTGARFDTACLPGR